MIQTPLFKRSFTLLVVIGILHIGATFLYLYSNVWWFDMVLHFLSGALVAMGVILLCQVCFKSLDRDKKKLIWFSFLAVMAIGFLWEMFEVHYGITFISDGIVYGTDTASDLMLDVSGGLLGSLYAFRFLPKP